MAFLAREAEQFSLTAEKSAGRLVKPPAVRDPITNPVNPARAPHAETSEINTSVHGNARGDIEHTNPKLSEETTPKPNIPPEKPIPPPKKGGGMSYTTMGLGAGALAFGAYATNLGGFKNASDKFAHDAGDAVGGIVDDGEKLVGNIAKDAEEVAGEAKKTFDTLLGFVSELPYVITAVVLVGGLIYLTSGSSKSTAQAAAPAPSAVEMAQMRQNYVNNLESVRSSAVP